MSSPTSGKNPPTLLVYWPLCVGCMVAVLALVPVPLAAQQWDVGLSAGGTLIEAIGSGDLENAPTILLIGGLDGNAASRNFVMEALESHRSGELGQSVSLLAIPMANPDGNPLAFPPSGAAYRENPESNALWRWIGVHAPDLVLVAEGGDFGLIEALSTSQVAGIGRIPARSVGTGESDIADALSDAPPPSEAALEIAMRRRRTPLELAGELDNVYGQDFNQLTYLPGMALIARLRLGDTDEVHRLASPYLDTVPEIRSSLNIAGHLVFAELAERMDDQRYLDLVRRAADLAFDENGEMLEAMPLHGEMSDAFFMSGPLLARAGRLTGDPRYYAMAARNAAFLDDLVLRPDGLYRHSPLTDAAWSRGNAFPALGMALTLSDLPDDHPAFSQLLASLQQHLARLADFQDADGMWHEVIDHRGSFAELSSTAMIATSMLRAIRAGWIDPQEFAPRVDAAWQAVLTRTGSDGSLVDVCESTNKQDSLQAYLDRTAILGPDIRGGGMILMFATEMAGLE